MLHAPQLSTHPVMPRTGCLDGRGERENGDRCRRQGGPGLEGCLDCLGSLTESAVPTPRSVRRHSEAQGCGEAGCFLASSPTVLLNHTDVRRLHIQGWQQVYDGLGAGNEVGEKL